MPSLEPKGDKTSLKLVYMVEKLGTEKRRMEKKSFVEKNSNIFCQNDTKLCWGNEKMVWGNDSICWGND